MAAASDDIPDEELTAALDKVADAFSLSRAELLARVLGRPAKQQRALPPAPPAPPAPEPQSLVDGAPIIRLWRRELIERMFVSLDAASLARLLCVARWPATNGRATLRRLAALLATNGRTMRRVDESARRAETQALLRIVRSREALFAENFEAGWRDRWALPEGWTHGLIRTGADAFTQTLVHANVPCGELVTADSKALRGLVHTLASSVRPGAARVKMCAPEGLELGKGCGYFRLSSTPIIQEEDGEEDDAIFCYFKRGEEDDEDDDDIEPNELALVLISDDDDDDQTMSTTLVHDAVPGQWYDVRFELDWTAKTITASVDGQEKCRGVNFMNRRTTTVSRIGLANYFTNAAGRWADIALHR